MTTSNGGIITQLHKLLWSTLTFLGNRRIIGILRNVASTYRDTIFYFEPDEKLVALTIDDGLARGGSFTCMVKEVVSLLDKYKAHATFFVCSDYCAHDEQLKQATRDLVLQQGHELGNHMSRDVPGYYSKLSKQEFRSEFQATNQVLEDLINKNGDERKDGPYRIRWFRAPQGIYTRAMQQVMEERNEGAPYSQEDTNRPIMRHVLGDCYCDDWALACRDANFCFQTTMRQVNKGSILITHMPERNTDREAILDVLERLLQELDNQGYRCVSLSEMWEACDGRHAHSDQ